MVMRMARRLQRQPGPILPAEVPSGSSSNSCTGEFLVRPQLKAAALAGTEPEIQCFSAAAVDSWIVGLGMDEKIGAASNACCLHAEANQRAGSRVCLDSEC